jgi:cytochrome c oxidase assembly protein subunit 15
MAHPRVASRRISPDGYRRLALATVVALVGLVVTGAAVRLTGSGLGCPKWPTCATGHVVAPDQFHPAIEFANRVLTGVVSAAMGLVALGAFLRAPRRRDLCVLGLGQVAGLLAEIVLGGVMVRHRLEPGLVMAHFLLSMLIVLDAVVLHHRASLPDGQRPQPAGRDLVWIGRLITAMVAVTLVAGTVVTGSGPHSGANSADGRVTRWHVNLHRVTQIHGAVAMLTVGLVAAAWWLLRTTDAPEEARRRLQHLVEAIAAQVAIGYTQYFSGVPALLVGFHVLGAVTVWVCALRFVLSLSSGVIADAQARPDRAAREPAPA